jgi:hypothetical protein
MKPGIGQYVKRRIYYLDNKNALNISIKKSGYRMVSIRKLKH